MKLYNTLTRKIEDIAPLNAPNITFYSCGPTVYDYTHIGHMRTYVNTDVLKRTLNFLGYKVKHAMNITDVGHLTGDDDSGEDKLEKGAAKTGRSVWEAAEFYTDYFLKMMDFLNIERPEIFPRATEHIEEMKRLINILFEKGYLYTTDEAVYFDISKFKDYGKLGGQKIEDKTTGARVEVHVDAKKKHPADFAVWFKQVGRFANHVMHWPSPWGDGFPGWHIECSAMSLQYLGETIDIHSGGIDHIPVHHENEIAQSEAATGKPFVTYWFHNNFLTIDGTKMSKSLGNLYTLEDIEKNGVEPAAVRLLFLQTHYRAIMNFTWDSAKASQAAFTKLKDQIRALRHENERTVLSSEKLAIIDALRGRFVEAISDDLQLPQAVSVMWEVLKSSIPSPDKLDLLYSFDEVLGLGLSRITDEEIPAEITVLAQERLQARKKGDFTAADELRLKAESMGYVIKDTSDGFTIKKK